jgi:hypothetical protein
MAAFYFVAFFLFTSFILFAAFFFNTGLYQKLYFVIACFEWYCSLWSGQGPGAGAVVQVRHQETRYEHPIAAKPHSPHQLGCDWQTGKHENFAGKEGESRHAFSPPTGEYSGNGDVEEEKKDEGAAQDTCQAHYPGIQGILEDTFVFFGNEGLRPRV